MEPPTGVILDEDFGTGTLVALGIGGCRRMSEEMITFRFRARDGFCIFQSFLRPLHLQELQTSFDERLRELLADDVEVDLGVNWACETAEPFLRVLQDERLLDFLVELCGLPLVAMRLELFEKRPGSSNLIPWHQERFCVSTR
ncbi:Uncharacterized protein SCF082_LOCUS26388 [Durusdinium trenchii]|uniref:Uncharacterized protein n=1 Tax=Durusdinium trenchii TaxID=1381693 RepID=A0ABP0M7F2_9DINO